MTTRPPLAVTRCERCKRPIYNLSAAKEVKAYLETYVYGPKCAREMGLTEPKERARRVTVDVVACEGQFPLFDDLDPTNQTMDTNQTAQTLRKMHAARVKAITPAGEPQRFSLTALDERFSDLLTAADALERETAARQQAQIALEAAYEARNMAHLEATRELRETMRAWAVAELQRTQADPHFDARHDAIESLCKLMGVTL